MKFLPPFLPPFVRSEVTSDTNKLSSYFHFGQLRHAVKGSPLSQAQRRERRLGEENETTAGGDRIGIDISGRPRRRRRILAGQHLHEFVCKPGAEPPNCSWSRPRIEAVRDADYYQAVRRRSRRAAAIAPRIHRSSTYRRRSSAIHCCGPPVTDELEAQALGAFHDASEAEKAAAETGRTEDDAS